MPKYTKQNKEGDRQKIDCNKKNGKLNRTKQNKMRQTMITQDGNEQLSWRLTTQRLTLDNFLRKHSTLKFATLTEDGEEHSR